MYKFRSKNQINTLGYQQCVNLKQHAPDHDKDIINESCKEANINKQTATRKQCEIVESTIIQTEVSQKISHETNKNNRLHLRSDVVNKTLLRAVKRFYSNKFKMLQKSIKRTSLQNAKAVDIFDVMTKF